MSTLISYLEETYLKFNNDDVEPSHLISSFGLSIPFEGREQLISQTEKLYRLRYENKTECDRNCHRIGMIGGCSGIGKTRGLIEISKRVKLWTLEDEWYLPIIISYNNGNSPHTEELMVERLGGVSTASCALAMRILYYTFIAGKYFNGSKTSFDYFVRGIPDKLLKSLSPEFALEEIIKYKSASQGKRVIFIGLDETNYLLGINGRRGVDGNDGYEKSNRQFLSDTLVALGTVVMMQNSFVFAVVAGTVVQPITTVFAESGHPIEPLPINLLSWEDSESIVDTLIPSLVGNWNDWRNCITFRRALADFGCMPRGAEDFLKEVKDYMRPDTKLSDLNYTIISNTLSGRRPTPDLPVDLVLTVLSDIILQSSVDRKSIVKGSSHVTYGDLESSGFALRTHVDKHITVELSFVAFRYHVDALMRAGRAWDPLVQLLGLVLNLCDVPDNRLMSWDGFEDFHCYIEAIREMMLFRRLCTSSGDKLEVATCSIREFYGVERGIDFDISLRRSFPVIEALHRFPPKDTITNNAAADTAADTAAALEAASTAFYKNTNGAPFDSFTVRRIGHGADGARNALFCLQQKRYINALVNQAMIREEWGKVNDSLPHTNRDDVKIVLVVFATRVNKVAIAAEDELPEECLLVTGEAMRKFYSPLLFSRANLCW